MKIVYVSDAIYPYLHGGKEKRLYELSTRLAHAGNEVHIYTMHWWKSTDKVVVEDGVTLHAISNYYEMYSGDRRTIKEGIMFGLACFKLFPVRFDVLDVDHMPFFPILSSWFVCVSTFRWRKFYGTWHEALTRREWVDYMGTSGNIASIIERICIRLPYSITAASERTQKLLKLQRKKNNKVRLVTPGIDYKLMQSIKPAKVKCDILCVCRLVKDKNVDVLVSSVAVLVKKDPKISCVVIGKGPEKQRLIRQVNKLGITKNVTLLDQLPNAIDVYSYMKAAKVFCLPTIREGFGIVTLEALGCGTPVVTIDIETNASCKFIKQQLNGSAIRLDVKDLVKAIRHWLKQKDKQSVNIAKNVSKYDWNNLSKEQLKVYMR